jgi:hypothetical protein
MRLYSENCTASAKPKRFSQTSSTAPRSDPDPPLLALTEDLGVHFTGFSYRGFIVTCNGDRLRVVAKMAFHEEQKETLREEAELYSELHRHKLDGIANYVGLYDDVDDEALVLVTTDVGNWLHTRHGNITQE